MDPDHEAFMFSRNPYQFPDHRPQFHDAVDFLTDNIAAGHIGIPGNRPENLQVVRQVVVRCNPVPDDGQRNPADTGQEPEHHAGFPGDRRHHLMDLPQPGGKQFPVQQGGIGYLRVFDAPPAVFPGDPKQQVLVQGIAAEPFRFPVPAHLLCVGQHFPVRDQRQVDPAEGILRRHSLGEYVAVQVNLFQIREHRLPVLGNGQGVPDPVDIILCVRRVAQDQLGKVDEGMVVNPAVPVFSGQAGFSQFLFRRGPPLLQFCRLGQVAPQSQFFDVVIGITQLAHNAQGNQRVRRQVAVHMRMQVRAELALAADIGFHDRLGHAQLVFPCLAHQGLGNGGNRSLQLHPSVREDVGDLRVSQPQDVHLPVVPVVVTGNLVPDHLQAMVILCGFQAAEPGQVGDQVAGMVVRRPDGIKQAVSLHAEVDRNILFLIQVELLKKDHALSFPAVRSFSSLLPTISRSGNAFNPVCLLDGFSRIWYYGVVPKCSLIRRLIHELRKS